MAEPIDQRIWRGVYSGLALAATDDLPLAADIALRDHVAFSAFGLARDIVIAEPRELTGGQQEYVGLTSGVAVIQREGLRPDRPLNALVDSFRQIWEMIDGQWWR